MAPPLHGAGAPRRASVVSGRSTATPVGDEAGGRVDEDEGSPGRQVRFDRKMSVYDACGDGVAIRQQLLVAADNGIQIIGAGKSTRSGFD